MSDVMMKNFFNLRVSTQLAIQLFLIIIMICSVVGIVFYAKRNVNYYYESTIEAVTHNQRLANHIKKLIYQMSEQLGEYIAASDPAQQEALKEEIHQTDSLIAEYEQKLFADEDQLTLFAHVRSEFAKWHGLKEEIFLLKRSNDVQKAMYVLNTSGKDICARFEILIQVLLLHDNALLNHMHEYIASGFYKLLYYIAVIVIVMFIVLLFMMIVIYNSIVTPLAHIKKVAEKVKAGDYSSRVQVGNDKSELGHVAAVINNMLDQIEHNKQGSDGIISSLDNLNCRLQLKNSEMEDFVKVIAHDIKSPLSTIEMYGDLLQREIGHSPERVLHDIERIQANTRRLRVLVDDLTEYSLVGSVELDKKNIPVQSIIEDVLGLMGKKESINQYDVIIENNTIKMTFLIGKTEKAMLCLDKSLPDLYAVPSQISQVFMNFFSNAIKYRSEKPLEIHVSGTLGNGETHLVFTDNGRGINPQYTKKIFDMCCRLVALSEVEGTGIGLAMVKKIIERHNGRVWAESKGEGHGASFHIILPAQ
jgi:signal transduction histidine kinase